MSTADQSSSKKRILAAAREEFASSGFTGARVQRIARRAGVNKQLLYYYFGSKERLYRAVVADATAIPERAGAQSGPATDLLRAAVQRIFQALESHQELVALLFEPPGTRSRGAAEAARALTREVRGVISDGQGLGYFRDDVDPDLAALQALILCAGFLGIGSALGDAPNDVRHTSWAESVSDLLTKGLAW